MSVNQFDSGGGGRSPLKGTRASGCVPDCVVTVGSDHREVPIVNSGVETVVRSEGPSDIARQSRVQVPMEWGRDENENNVAEAINGLSGQTPKRQHCTIELLDPYESTDDEPVWRPIHSGYISAAGGHTDRGTARFRVSDYSHLLSEVPASVTFDAGASLTTVLTYVKDTLIDGQEVIDNLQIGVRNIDGDTRVDDQKIHVSEIDESGEGLEEAVSGDTELESLDVDGVTEVFETEYARSLAELLGVFEFDQLDTPRSFGADRDTLSDVMNWIDRHLGVRWYFEPRPPYEPPLLVIDGNPALRSFHDGNHVDPPTEDSTPIKVLQNNALYQLNPQNKLRARGRAPSTGEEMLGWVTQNDGVKRGEFPVVTVGYRPLLDQTEDDYPPNEIDVDAVTMTEVENIARTELEDRLSGAAGGEIRLPMTPMLRPYSRLDAVPVCGSHAPTDVPAISYQAEEVIHYITTAQSETDPPSPRTVVRCGLYVNPDEIETLSSEMMEA